MEFIYKLRYKKNNLYIWRNPLEEYWLVLSESADIYRSISQVPQSIKLNCGTILTKHDLEIVKFAVIPHEIVEFEETIWVDDSSIKAGRITMSPKIFDYLKKNSIEFQDLLKSAENNKNKYLAEQDKI